MNVIVYERFWKTLERSGITTYSLVKVHNVSKATLNRLRHNRPLTTTTLNDICRILGCRIEDIMEYVTSEEDQRL